MTTLFDKEVRLEIGWMVRFVRQRRLEAGTFSAASVADQRETRGPFEHYEDAVEFSKSIRGLSDTVAGFTHVFPDIRRVKKENGS